MQCGIYIVNFNSFLSLFVKNTMSFTRVFPCVFTQSASWRRWSLLRVKRGYQQFF